MLRLLSSAALVSLGLATTSQASIIVAFEETATGVVSTYSGSLDLDYVTNFTGSSVRGVLVYPAYYNVGYFHIGISGVSSDTSWSSATGPGAPAAPTSYSGDSFGFRSDVNGTVYLPSSYQANTYISGSMTFDGMTLADLRVNAGTFNNAVTFSTGDYISVTATAFGAQVPLPASQPLLAAGLGVVGALRRRKP